MTSNDCAFNLELPDEVLQKLEKLSKEEGYPDLNDFISHIISTSVSNRTVETNSTMDDDGYYEIILEVDDCTMGQLETLAEKNGCDDLDEYANTLFKSAMQRITSTSSSKDIILTVPEFLITQLDLDVKHMEYKSRSEAILYILRFYYDIMEQTK